jgi:hypothetical protein
MEKETRNAIQTATQKARRILEADFAGQLEGLYDIMLDGRFGVTGGAHLTSRQISGATGSLPPLNTSAPRE